MACGWKTDVIPISNPLDWPLSHLAISTYHRCKPIFARATNSPVNCTAHTPHSTPAYHNVPPQDIIRLFNPARLNIPSPHLHFENVKTPHPRLKHQHWPFLQRPLNC